MKLFQTNNMNIVKEWVLYFGFEELDGNKLLNDLLKRLRSYYSVQLR